MLSWLRKRKTIEAMLADLAAVGINLRPGIAVERLVAEQTRAQLEKSGYEVLLAAMGDQEFDEKTFKPGEFLSDDVWHFDAEAIEGHGDYVRIVESCRRLAGDDLRIERVRDFVDVEARVAWIELSINGRSEHIDMKVDDDWADKVVFDRIQGWLDESGAGRRFYANDLGQDTLLVCKRADEVKKINQATGLHFTNLNM